MNSSKDDGLFSASATCAFIWQSMVLQKVIRCRFPCLSMISLLLAYVESCDEHGEIHHLNYSNLYLVWIYQVSALLLTSTVKQHEVLAQVARCIGCAYFCWYFLSIIWPVLCQINSLALSVRLATSTKIRVVTQIQV